jgi:hypothetical protein
MPRQEQRVNPDATHRADPVADLYSVDVARVRTTDDRNGLATPRDQKGGIPGDGGADQEIL